MTNSINGLPESMAQALERIADIEMRCAEMQPETEGTAAIPFSAYLDTSQPVTYPPNAAKQFTPLILQAAARFRLRPALLHALVEAESGGNPDAVSPRGAIGLTQLMPSTAEALGVANPYDPQQNLNGGAQYLRRQLDRFGGDERLALAAYNAGPGAVQRYQGVPPYAETRNYVNRVLSLAATYDQGK